MQVKLSKVRLAFPALFEPKAINEGAPKYGAVLIIEPGSANAKAVEDAMAAAAKDKWDAKAAGTLKTLRSKDRVCFHTTEKTNSAGDPVAGFEGKHYLTTSSAARPPVYDRDKSPLTQADGKPYGGCYVNAVVDVWAMDNQYGQRICATLQGVQFHSDGASFSGGRVASADDFDVVEETTEDDLV